MSGLVTFAHAHDSKVQSQRDPESFILVPTDNLSESLRKEVAKPYQEFIKLLRRHPDYSNSLSLAGRTLIMTDPENGIVSLRTSVTSFGGIDQDAELTCYKCCFGKIDKERCGDYSNVHLNKNWAEHCPLRKK